jgi:L-threonylcarbamoyladenylate synthase
MQATQQAVAVLKRGGVIAYPTEHCFGLGCDPNNRVAIARLLKIKQRSAEQGLILIASSTAQVELVAELQAAAKLAEILDSWPGPVSWLLDARENVSGLVRGRHTTVAMRVTAHPVAQQLCDLFGGAIVSTSANRHAKPALLTADAVAHEMGDELDFILAGDVGGAAQPSQIRDGATGAVLR